MTVRVVRVSVCLCCQRHRFTEADYRGERFKDYHKDIKGNNDILSLTQV